MSQPITKFRLTESEAVVILAVAVIGLGDIWRLPSLAMNYGGGAFLLVYYSAILLLGTPVLMAELAFGKLGDARFAEATRIAVKGLHLPRGWLILVATLPLAGLAIIALYGALAGWSLGYVFRAAGGSSLGLDPDQARTLFLDLAGDPERSLIWHTLFWMGIGVVSAHGWRQGIRRGAFYFGGLMLLLTLLLADALPSLTADNSGVDRMLGMRWDELTGTGVWAALTQACFTLSVGLGIVYVTGRQLRLDAHGARVALGVVSFDIIFGLVIGTAMASLIAHQGVANSGLTLVFVDLVVGLGDQKAAQVLFFSLLLLLSASSAMLLIEPFVQSVQDRFHCRRTTAAGAVVMLAWLLGLLVILSFGPWQHWRPFGRSLVDWLVYIGVDVLVPLNCLVVASFVGRALPASLVVAASGSRLLIMGPWYLWLRFGVRLTLVIVLLKTSGIMDAVQTFFAPVEDIPSNEFG